MAKNHGFLKPSRWAKKCKKSGRGVPKGRQRDFDRPAGVPFRGARVPKQQESKIDLQQDSSTREGIPTRPWAEGPPNLVSYSERERAFR